MTRSRSKISKNTGDEVDKKLKSQMVDLPLPGEPINIIASL